MTLRQQILYALAVAASLVVVALDLFVWRP